MLIVIGYSGNCDPVFQELSERFSEFPHRLCWVHYGEGNPSDEVVHFLKKRKAFLVKGYDADTFMRTLVLEGLELDFPDIIRNPIAATKKRLIRVMQFPRKEDELPDFDPLNVAHKEIDEAQKLLHKSKEPYRTLYAQITLAGATLNQNTLDEVLPQVLKLDNPDLSQAYCDAYYRIISKALKDKSTVKALELIDNLNKYPFIKNDAWFYLLWGNALSDQAKTKQDAEADHLFEASYDKYKRAIEIKPDMHEAFYNWGNALYCHAKQKEGSEADNLYEMAYDKYERAIEIKPDKHEAFNNWGAVLSDHAKQKEGSEANHLFEASYDKYERAIEIKPDKHEAFSNWGVALCEQAKIENNAEAERLYIEACDKFKSAIDIKHDYYEALNNWGVALYKQANKKDGAEAERLYEMAYDKYKYAIEIKPDDYEAYCNWGLVLMMQAQKKDGVEAEQFFDEAEQKYSCALAIKPDDYDAFYNLGCLQALRGNVEEALEALQQWAKLNAKANRIKIANDQDFDRIREDVKFQAFVASLPEK